MIRTVPPTEQRFVMYGLTWEQYEGLLRAFGDRRLRHTYDQGTLEIMSPSKNHEWLKGFIRDLITTICRVVGIQRQGVGSMTMKREDLDRGLEPDEGFYIGKKSLAKVVAKRDYDPHRDPPPDLVVEVDITSSSLKRMDIYRRLRVPEVWRHDGRKMIFYGLDKRGHYRQIRRSRAFRFLSAEDLTRFIDMRDGKDDTELESLFEQWVREQTEKKNGKKK